MSHPIAADSDSRCCSFCRKTQGDVARLFSNPSDYARAYICDECVMVCATILAEFDGYTADLVHHPVSTAHPFLQHPQLLQFLAAAEQWRRQESLGGDAAEELAQMRTIADSMMRQG